MIEQKPLRCAILAVGDFPEGGASSQRQYLMAKILTRGLGPTILWILHPTTKTPVQENISVSGTWQSVEFNYLSGTTIRPSTAFGALTDTLKGITQSIRLLIGQKSRPDVVVVYTPFFLKFILPMLAVKLLGIPLIVETCEIRSKMEDKKELNALRRLANGGESLMEKLIPKLAQGILPISHSIRDYYENLGISNNAAYLLPILIDAEYYQSAGNTPISILENQRYLLNSGSFTEKDGIPFLIEAVRNVREKHLDIKLVFTGNAKPEVQQKIQCMADVSGPADWIIFTGFISRDELIWCYKNATGLLSCRSNSSFANYGFPTKLAEYLASSRPVVATRVGDIEDYLIDEVNAYLSTPEDPQSIADAILKLLDDPDKANFIGKKGNEVARQSFDYRNHVKNVSRFIQRRIYNQHDSHKD